MQEIPLQSWEGVKLALWTIGGIGFFSLILLFLIAVILKTLKFKEEAVKIGFKIFGKELGNIEIGAKQEKWNNTNEIDKTKEIILKEVKEIIEKKDKEIKDTIKTGKQQNDKIIISKDINELKALIKEIVVNEKKDIEKIYEQVGNINQILGVKDILVKKNRSVDIILWIFICILVIGIIITILIFK